MRELGILFGNTTQAAGTALAAFFLGLAVGSWHWGRRAATLKSPLKVFALLELGVASTALLFLGLSGMYRHLYGALYHTWGNSPSLFLGLKFLLGVTLLFPPSYFMGGTLPVLAQHSIAHRSGLGFIGTTLYATNTLGAACGAFAVVFWLLPAYGYSLTYGAGISLSLAVACAAWLMAPKSVNEVVPTTEGPSSEVLQAEPSLPSLKSRLGLLSFLCGFLALATEVLWMRMFAQVMPSSIYTFSAVLVLFLLSLAGGAALAHRCCGAKTPPLPTLMFLFTSAGTALALSTWLYQELSGGSLFNPRTGDWSQDVSWQFLGAALVIVPPGVLMGSIFPYLLKLSEPLLESPGSTVGDLAAMNLLGSIFGSLASGFLFLDLLGLGGALRFVAATYLILALVLAGQKPSDKLTTWPGSVPALALLLVLSLLDPGRLPPVTVDTNNGRESLFLVREGSAASVAVVQSGQSRRIKVNNFYTLGGSSSAVLEERQTHLAISMHPNPKRLFYLGMGTGITAGGAMRHPVERVVVSELLPEVPDLSRRFFHPWLNGLFEHPGVEVINEDGRNLLSSIPEQYDLIIADLFLPWESGAGSLWTAECFQSGLSRLATEGLYVQWLPLYQISEEEFRSVVATMHSVFPLVTLWRGDFLSKRPIVAVVGHRDPTPLTEVTQAEVRLREAGVRLTERKLGDLPILAYYVGNLTAAPELFEGAPINTDDRPFIEFSSPRTLSRSRKEPVWFTGPRLLDFYERLKEASPDSDPFLKLQRTDSLSAVQAGYHLFRYRVLRTSPKNSHAGTDLTETYRLLERAPGQTK